MFVKLKHLNLDFEKVEQRLNLVSIVLLCIVAVILLYILFFVGTKPYYSPLPQTVHQNGMSCQECKGSSTISNSISSSNSTDIVTLKLGEPRFELYYNDHCGGCIRFKPIWNEVKYNNPPIPSENFVEIDCSNPKNVSKCVNIRFIPHVLYYDGSIDGKPVECKDLRTREDFVRCMAMY